VLRREQGKLPSSGVTTDHACPVEWAAAMARWRVPRSIDPGRDHPGPAPGDRGARRGSTLPGKRPVPRGRPPACRRRRIILRAAADQPGHDARRDRARRCAPAWEPRLRWRSTRLWCPWERPPRPPRTPWHVRDSWTVDGACSAFLILPEPTGIGSVCTPSGVPIWHALSSCGAPDWSAEFSLRDRYGGP